MHNAGVQDCIQRSDGLGSHLQITKRKCSRGKATARKKAHEGGQEMEPQARHEEKAWHRHVDDEEESARALSET